MSEQMPPREQAAAWYEAEAAKIGPCALASTWRKFAARVRNGDADSRIMELLASQDACLADQKGQDHD